MTARPASEQLVAATAAFVGDRPLRVADIGTGSGAVAIAIAARCAKAEVWATDTNGAACCLAEANVRRQGLANRVFIRRGDLLAPLAGRFDVIVANLPYLAAATASAHPELAAEPFDAVFGSGDGLDAYRRLVPAASKRLTDDGLLLLQLHRRVVGARRSALPALAAALRPPASAVAAAAAGAAA